MTININPFGTSTDSPTNNLAQIKLFGCTVVDFNVSADWSSQGGSLSCRLIESDTDGDRLTIPVLGSPVLFELKDTSGNVVYLDSSDNVIGIVQSDGSVVGSSTFQVKLPSPQYIPTSVNDPNATLQQISPEVIIIDQKYSLKIGRAHV